MTDEKQTPKIIKANPAANCPTMPSDWFIEPPSPDKYMARGGNAIELLNCGEAYLPALKDAIEKAKHSIYIINWGFDDELDLCMLEKNNSGHPDNWISTILEQKAAGTHWSTPNKVEVKILVFYNWLNETFMESTLHENAWYDLSQTWSQKAMSGKISNLQFMTRDIQEGWFYTHHQKCILIDHRKDTANGFVQGFNLKPDYFDFAAHPYRENEKQHYQDVGLHLRGPCLIDLFHNFQEGWNKALNDRLVFWKDRGIISIKESSPTINEIKNKDILTYNAQILRTWMLNGETSICKFILNAIPRINEFIYIEDQYFRYPDFADQLMNRGSEIKKKCGNQKLLYVFVVLTPNVFAVGESDNRLIMVDFLGRNDVDADKKTFNERQSDGEHKKIIDEMNKNGVMVHICQLLASGKTKNWINQEVIDYKNIYVHAKLSIYDDAYLLLGSANWNRRSMEQDSELDIAVQYHDGGDNGSAKSFREQLWNAHFDVRYLYDDPKGKMYTPTDWYEEWDKKLQKNWGLFHSKKSLMMNLFLYYENIKDLKWKSIKQWFD